MQYAIRILLSRVGWLLPSTSSPSSISSLSSVSEEMMSHKMVKTTQPFMIDYREQGETVRLISSYNIASPLLALPLKYSMNTFNFCPLNQTVSHSIFIENLVLS